MARLTWGAPRQLILTGAVLLGLASSGCHRKAETAGATETASVPTQEAGKIPMRGDNPGSFTILPTNTLVIPENADMNATLEQLSVELRKYVVRKRTAPKSFEEFAAKRSSRRWGWEM